MPTPIPDEAAVLFAAEYPRLVGALTLHTGQPALAEELAQEALLRACRRWEHVRGLESPGGWIRRVALNLASSHFRRTRAARRAQVRLETADTVHHDPDVAESLAVRRAVSRLPDRQKTALVMRYYLGMTVEETATHLDVSQDAVRSLTKRALAALRNMLGAEVPTAHVKEVDGG